MGRSGCAESASLTEMGFARVRSIREGVHGYRGRVRSGIDSQPERCSSADGEHTSSPMKGLTRAPLAIRRTLKIGLSSKTRSGVRSSLLQALSADPPAQSPRLRVELAAFATTRHHDAVSHIPAVLSSEENPVHEDNRRKCRSEGPKESVEANQYGRCEMEQGRSKE